MAKVSQVLGSFQQDAMHPFGADPIQGASQQAYRIVEGSRIGARTPSLLPLALGAFGLA